MKIQYGRWWAIGVCVSVLLALCIMLRRPAISTCATSDLPGIAIPLLADQRHIPYPAAPHTPYNSIPPTSGPHVPQTIAPGVYRAPIPEEIQVHALEHGHVLVQYAPDMAIQEIQFLEDLARRYPRTVVVAPYGKLRTGIALTAWGRIDRLDRVEADRINSFIVTLDSRYNHGWC